MSADSPMAAAGGAALYTIGRDGAVAQAWRSASEPAGRAA